MILGFVVSPAVVLPTLSRPTLFGRLRVRTLVVISVLNGLLAAIARREKAA
jgi:hypothetical protein